MAANRRASSKYGGQVRGWSWKQESGQETVKLSSTTAKIIIIFI